MSSFSYAAAARTHLGSATHNLGETFSLFELLSAFGRAIRRSERLHDFQRESLSSAGAQKNGLKHRRAAAAAASDLNCSGLGSWQARNALRSKNESAVRRKKERKKERRSKATALVFHGRSKRQEIVIVIYVRRRVLKIKKNKQETVKWRSDLLQRSILPDQESHDHSTGLDNRQHTYVRVQLN